MEEKKEIENKANYCLNCKTKPCHNGCPLGNDIPSFIKCVKEEKYEEAYHILCQTTVLQPICGRICPHRSQCEGSCVRGIKGEPVSIGDLEAFIGDMAIKEGYEIPKEQKTRNKTIAVVGGGPAGITCAASLARKGYLVTIYEKQPKLGGILRYGIPNFRLEKEILDAQLEKILNLGIQVKYGQELGNTIQLEELKEQYDAVFLSIGANISCKMNIPGEELEGVYGGNELLETNEHPNYKEKKVCIIGGGNVAMDAARTIKKFGAKEVNIIYRRAEKQMPAEKKEIAEAKQEGIHFLFQTNPIKILGNTKVEAIECVKTELVKKEGEAREVPVTIEGSNEQIQTDFVVMAVGSKTEEKVIKHISLDTTKWGYLVIDENYQTSQEKIFAGGDLGGIKATVAWASRSGRKAAENIENYLENK